MKNGALFSLAIGLILVSLSGWVLAGPVSIPFSDDFENLTNGTPLINGTNGWYADSSNAVVQTNMVSSGTNAAQIPIDCTLSNRVVSAAYTSIWIQIDSRIIRYDGENPPTVNTNVAVYFYANSNGNIVVHNGAASPSTTNSTNWVTLTNIITGAAAVPVTETNWTRIDLHQDFTAKTWDLFVNYVLMTNNIGFINTNVSALNSLGVYNGNAATSYLDNVWVSTTNPPDMDQHGSNWLPYIVTDTSTFACAIMENHSVTQHFDIWKTNGYYDLRFTNTISLPGGETWLSLTPSTGTSTGTGDHQQITVTYNTLGLSPGSYTGLITVAGNDATLGFTAGNSPTTMAVSMTVKARPILSVSRTNLSQVIPKGSNPTNQSFDIWNGSGTPIVPMTYTLAMSNDTGCMSLNFTNGTSTGEHDPIGVIFSDMSTYEAGTYTGRIAVLAWDSGTDYVPAGAETQTTELAVTVQVIVPDAPSQIWASDGTDTSRVSVCWTPTASTGTMAAVTYELWRYTTFDVGYASKITDVATTNYEDSSALPGVLYYYWVRAVNAFGVQGQMSEYDPGYRALSAPQGVQATDGAYTNQIVVNWSGADGASSYEVYRSVSATPATGSIVYNTDGHMYADVQVADGAKYWYQVKAVKGPYISALSTADVGYVLSNPTDISATKGTYSTRVQVSWNPVSGATGYEVWRNSVALSQSSGKLGDAVSLTYNDSSVAPGTVYYYWVKARSTTAIGGFSGTDNGYAATGAVDLAIWNLTMLPTVLPAGSHPTVASFRMQNNGPSVLTAPNTAMGMNFYMGPTRDISQAVAVGSAIQDVTLAVGADTIVKVSGVAGVTMPSTTGDYYVFVQVAPVWPNLLADDNQGDNITIGIGMIRVTESGTAHYWAINDYDGDGISDLAVYDASRGTWSVRTTDGRVLGENVSFGGTDCIPTVGDYDGDAKADPAVYAEASGKWQVLLSGSGYAQASATLAAGTGCLTVPADYDGDGKADPVVYQESSGWWTGMLSGSGYAQASGQFGAPGYQPVPGDYDGDGTWDLAVYQEATGYWFIRTPAGELLKWGAYWGSPGYSPVPGDYDGDGIWDLAVYAESTGQWYIRTLSETVLAAGTSWGLPGYIPVPGDYDGDGLWDLAVYNTTSGKWYVRSVQGRLILFDSLWGSSSATPVKW